MCLVPGGCPFCFLAACDDRFYFFSSWFGRSRGVCIGGNWVSRRAVPARGSAALRPAHAEPSFVTEEPEWGEAHVRSGGTHSPGRPSRRGSATARSVEKAVEGVLDLGQPHAALLLARGSPTRAPRGFRGPRPVGDAHRPAATRPLAASAPPGRASDADATQYEHVRPPRPASPRGRRAAASSRRRA